MHLRKSHLPPELVIVDYLLERWARWARHQLSSLGWPATSMTGKMIEWHELALEPEKLFPANGTDKAPDGVMQIDSAVAKLPKKLARAVYAEYFTGGTRESKAKSIRMPTLTFRQTLLSAQWVIFGRINI
jgi:hypothetical protein